MCRFLSSRSNEAISEITKQDVVAFRNSLIKQVSAKTANHDLKAPKMMFKSAERDSVINEDPTEFVEPVRRERASKSKRPYTLLPQTPFPPTEREEVRKEPSFEDIVLDEAEIARLLE